MLMSEKIDQVSAAFVAAQEEMGVIPFDKVNPHFRNKYASLSSTIQACRPVLYKHGLAIMQPISTDKETGDVVVVTLLMHTSGQYIGGEMRMKPAKASDPQSVGVLTTYMRRYSEQGLLNVAGDDDDDGEAGAAVSAAAARPQAQKQPAPVAQVQSKQPNIGADDLSTLVGLLDRAKDGPSGDKIEPQLLKQLGVSAVEHIPANRAAAAISAVEKFIAKQNASLNTA